MIKIKETRKDCQSLKVDKFLHRFIATELVRQIERFEHMREWRIEASDTLNWCLQVQEAFFLDGRGQLGAETWRQWRFVRNEHTTRLLDRLKLK